MAASTSKATDTSARTPKADPRADAPAADANAEPSVDQDQVVSDCVVNGGRGMHVGRAVNGKVCSYHAMAYKADGTRRDG